MSERTTNRKTEVEKWDEVKGASEAREEGRRGDPRGATKTTSFLKICKI